MLSQSHILSILWLEYLWCLVDKYMSFWKRNIMYFEENTWIPKECQNRQEISIICILTGQRLSVLLDSRLVVKIDLEHWNWCSLYRKRIWTGRLCGFSHYLLTENLFPTFHCDKFLHDPSQLLLWTLRYPITKT